MKINFWLRDETCRVVEADGSKTVMRAAVANDVSGIDGDCGGEMSCATCHVYVHPEWFDRLPARDMYEDALLESTMDPRPNSRLSCQIPVTPELDGLTVTVAN